MTPPRFIQFWALWYLLVTVAVSTAAYYFGHGSVLWALLFGAVGALATNIPLFWREPPYSVAKLARLIAARMHAPETDAEQKAADPAPTTREDIKQWFDEGVQQRAAFLVVATDQFSWEDYPVYVGPTADVSAVVKGLQEAELSGVMEVYDLSADRDGQLANKRTWAIENPPPRSLDVQEILRHLS